MRIGILAIAVLVLIAAGAVPAVAINTAISDQNNTVNYVGFDVGDPWNITIWNATTGALAYDFSGTIGSHTGQSWKVWFSCPSKGQLDNSIQRIIIMPGTYSVTANGTHGSTLYSDGPTQVTVNATDGETGTWCEQPISPIPELSTIMLVSAGLLGILMISRKYRGK